MEMKQSRIAEAIEEGKDSPIQHAPYSEFNDWWLSLDPEHRKVLMEDKWRLADNAYAAGQQNSSYSEIERLRALLLEERIKNTALTQQLNQGK